MTPILQGLFAALGVAAGIHIALFITLYGHKPQEVDSFGMVMAVIALVGYFLSDLDRL
jgi:hypothetical protein